MYMFKSKFQSIDLLFAAAFLLEQSPITCIIMDLIGAVCVVYGLIVFFMLDAKAKRSKYTGKTLSESYQIKQVASVVGILKPLIWAYTMMSSSCSSFLFPALYLVLFANYSTYSTLYQVLTNVSLLNIPMFHKVISLSLILWF